MTYKNPPLIEIVFEVFFKPKNWNDITTPGVFYSKLEGKFPNVSTRTINTASKLNITQYKKNDGGTMIQLSNGMFSVNKTGTYNGWIDFLEDIKFAYSIFSNSIEILSMTRIGLRYINKIDIEIHSIPQIKKFLNIYPQLPNGTNFDANSMQLLLESQKNDVSGKDVMSVNVSTLNPDSNNIAPILLEIDCIRFLISNNIECDEWLSSSHDKIDNLFDQILTSYSKGKFGGHE